MRHISLGLLVVALITSGALQAQVQARSADSNEFVNLRITQPSPQILRHAESLSAGLQPTARVWVLEQAKAESQRPSPDLETLNALIRQRLAGFVANSPRIPSMPGGSAQPEIESVAFVVMMQATRDNEDDLKAQLATLQAMNQQRAGERELFDDLNSELANRAQPGLPCTSPVCRSLTSRVESINQVNTNLGRPSRLQAAPDMSYQQVANLQLQLGQNLQSMNELSDMTSMRLQMTMDRRSKFIQALSNIEKKITNTSSAIVQNMK